MSQASDSEREQPNTVSNRAGYVVVACGIGLTVGSVVAVLQLWSGYEAATGEDAPQSINFSLFGFIRETTSPGTMILIMVAAAGVLGGTLTGLRHAATWLGLKKFGNQWLAWYLIRPFIGAGIALTVYLVLVGGLLGAGTSTSEINSVGVVALAVLSGMFSRNAVEKLGDVFNTIFSRASEEQADDDLATRLKRFADLRDDGVLSDEEFSRLKKLIIDQADVESEASASGGDAAEPAPAS